MVIYKVIAHIYREYSLERQLWKQKPEILRRMVLVVAKPHTLILIQRLWGFGEGYF